MRIQPSTTLFSSLRFLCSLRSTPLADYREITAATSALLHGSAGPQICDSCLFAPSRNSWRMLKILLFGPAALTLGLSGNIVLADGSSASNLTINNDSGGDFITGLRRIEDGSIISNSHTIKWRIFTDNGRDFFRKGKLEEAEKYFQSALQEAKEGFGLRDAHVASASNNLAEIYKARREFDKAEPLYLEAIDILEESFGSDDIRVGATLHNLGLFYLLQRKVDQAQKCFERALKIEGRVLGYGHTDYGNTMYHLGKVLYLQGKEKDSEALLRESIKILEENGLGETKACLSRIRYLTHMLIKSQRFSEAEILQRKVLHILEISKGWNLLETIIAADGLAMTLQALERLEEAHELLVRCLDARKNILQAGDIQVAVNMLHLGKIALLKSNQAGRLKVCNAKNELDEAKLLTENSIRIAKGNVNNSEGRQGVLKSSIRQVESMEDRKSALIILLQSVEFLGLLEATRSEMLAQASDDLRVLQAETERPLLECISIFQESATRSILLSSEDVKKEYISCLNYLMNIQSSNSTSSEKLKKEAQKIKDELLSGL